MAAPLFLNYDAQYDWLIALRFGLMAHFGLGYTLVERGRPRDAYDRLRAYAELVPSNS